MRDGSWIVHRVPNKRARARLFCYPHAGGGAAAFVPWRGKLPEAVELCPIEPPGRWTRHRHPLLRRVEESVDGLVADLGDLLDLPYVLLGHSLGSFVMFEAAKRFEELGGPSPAHLVVTASGAPQLRSKGVELYTLSDDVLLRKVAELYGAERVAAMADPEFRSLFLPVLRADLEALGTYACTSSQGLSVPISAYGGRLDAAVSEDRLLAWEAQTRGPFESAILEGGHFFIHEPASGFRERLMPILEAVARA